METKKFNPGDVVVIKSGSPKMTVVFCTDYDATCIYYNTTTDKIIKDEKISIDCLELFVENQ
jgi:uncharacterized protein YodC (DUF2158 family)